MQNRTVIRVVKLLGTATTAGVLGYGSGLHAEVLTYDASLGSTPIFQGWTFSGNFSPTTTVSGGAMTYGPTSVNGTTFWTHSPSITVNTATDVSSIEAEIMLSGSDWGNFSGFRRAGFSLLVTDSLGRWIIADIGDNRISLGNDDNRTSDPSAVVNFTDAFRTVRLEAGPMGGRLFVDGALTLSLALGTGRSGGAQGWFGDGTILANANSTSIRRVTYSAVPTPSAAAGFMVAGAMAMRRRRVAGDR